PPLERVPGTGRAAPPRGRGARPPDQKKAICSKGAGRPPGGSRRRAKIGDSRPGLPVRPPARHNRAEATERVRPCGRPGKPGDSSTVDPGAHPPMRKLIYVLAVAVLSAAAAAAANREATVARLKK